MAIPEALPPVQTAAKPYLEEYYLSVGRFRDRIVIVTDELNQLSDKLAGSQPAEVATENTDSEPGLLGSIDKEVQYLDASMAKLEAAVSRLLEVRVA